MPDTLNSLERLGYPRIGVLVIISLISLKVVEVDLVYWNSPFLDSLLQESWWYTKVLNKVMIKGCKAMKVVSR